MPQVCCHLEACNLQGSQQVCFHRVGPDPWISVAPSLLPSAPPSGNSGPSTLPLVSASPSSCTERSFLGFHDLCKKIIPVNPHSQQPTVGEGRRGRGKPLSLGPSVGRPLPSMDEENTPLVEPTQLDFFQSNFSSNEVKAQGKYTEPA